MVMLITDREPTEFGYFTSVLWDACMRHVKKGYNQHCMCDRICNVQNGVFERT